MLYSRGLSDYLMVLDAQLTLNDVEDRLAVSETAVATGLVRNHKPVGRSSDRPMGDFDGPGDSR